MFDSFYVCYILLGTPLTPTANLKMLVAAASALDEDKATCGISKTEDDLFANGSQSSGRKMKSLSLLCDRYECS